MKDGGYTASSASSGSERLDDDFSSPDLEEAHSSKDKAGRGLCEKHLRLVAWNTEIISKVLKEVIAHREASSIWPDPPAAIQVLEKQQLQRDLIVLEEVQDVIVLPKFDPEAAQREKEVASGTTLNDVVKDQLHNYIQTVAAMYHANPFHNFEVSPDEVAVIHCDLTGYTSDVFNASFSPIVQHASHVTMSVVKLLSRIVAPDVSLENEQDLHDHTYGITSDPLTQFSVILSALIHDVDHYGVPNTQLVKEGASIAAVYKNKSIAEQNSVDLAWELLMQDQFQDLRAAIYSTKEEFKRFRQLIVNSVMATDIMDKELSLARKGRWNIAFAESSKGADFISKEEDTNRKATIVIEHLMQASDVAHTMQHWHIYRKWNARLFEEMHKAFMEGRADKNPADNWYEGEKGFFDFYIIPLARKLKDCGVFGVSSDEYLNYAIQNRQEWEAKGQQIVAAMAESVSATYAEQKKSQKKEQLVQSLSSAYIKNKEQKKKAATAGDLKEDALISL